MRYYYLVFLPFFVWMFCGCDDFLERDIEGQTIEVIAPKSGVHHPEGEVTFLWRTLKGARNYHLTIVSPSFAAATRVVADTILRADSLSAGTRFSQRMTVGHYEWSICAANGAYATDEQLFELTVDSVAATD